MLSSNFSLKISPNKSKPQLNSTNKIISPYLVSGKIHKKINYSSKYSLDNFIPVIYDNNEIRTIGSGSFGNVYLAQNKIDNKIYAIKHMQKNKLLKLLRTLKGIYREIDIQSRIEHENIIKILYTFEDKESFNLVMEYASNGNLFHFIRKNKGLSESQAFQLFIQVVNAVYFLHKNDLIHRDIKPENILLFDNNNNKKENDNNNFLVKLCDFGWCVKLDGESRNTFCGTTEYMSPELIEHKIYSKEIDVWSLGILLYEMIHGYSPFRPKKPKFNEKEVFNNIRRHNLKFGKNISDRCKQLIINLLAFNKNKRYKIEDIYNSEFVKYYERNNFLLSKPNQVIRSFSRIYENTTNRNYIYKRKKFCNSFINKIPKNINEISFTKRKSKRKNSISKLNLNENNYSFKKEKNFSFIKDLKSENKNKRKQHINSNNKINFSFNKSIEKNMLHKNNSFKNITEFKIYERKKSVTKNNTMKKNKYKEEKGKEKLENKKIIKEYNSKKDKNKQEHDTIKLTLFSENFIRYILKDFQLNNTNYINKKSPEIRNLLFENDMINKDNKKNNNHLNILSNTATKRNVENNKKRLKEKNQILNINIPKSKNKIKYITKQISKSNSFSNLNTGKKILTSNNILNYSSQKPKDINEKSKKIFNVKVKKNYYSPKREKMFINRINNINYQNNNINNFYIINNTNINNLENNSINKKQIYLQDYIKKVKIDTKNKNKNKKKKDLSQDSEKSTTPKKDKDNIKINPIKLLGDFKKEFNLFHNNNK